MVLHPAFPYIRSMKYRLSFRKHTKLFKILVLCSLPLLGGCLSTPVLDSKPTAYEPELYSDSDQITDASDTPKPTELPTIEKVVEPVGSIWDRMRPKMQLADIQHPRIDKYRRYFQKKPHAFTALIKRSGPYLHYILEEIEKRNMPMEYALIPAVESAFKPYVSSSLGASGLWQIMPSTGRYLGLESSRWHDERRDIRLATATALDYLQSHAKRYDGNWLYALAAYNAGAGRVNKAIRRAKKNNSEIDYWMLELPGETDAYIPKLLAFSQIIKYPEQLGFVLPEIPDQAYFDVVELPGQTDLRVAAKAADLEVDKVLQLNTGFKRWATHPEGPHELLLPIESIDTFHLNIQSASLLTAHSDKLLVLPGKKRAVAHERLRYKVRRGDSLYKIARRFKVKVADLKRWNQVGKYIKPGQRLTVYLNRSS